MGLFTREAVIKQLQAEWKAETENYTKLKKAGKKPPRPVCIVSGELYTQLQPHRMDRSKVEMLILLAEAHGEWVKVEAGNKSYSDGELVRAPYRAQAHASRLEWFGLAEHGPTRSGLYRITPNGYKFLKGELLVPSVIYCRNGKTVETQMPMIGINQVKDLVFNKEYWDQYPDIEYGAT